VTEDERVQLVSLLKKGLEWGEKANKEKVEITKELGAFTRKSNHHQNGISLTFFSANEGKQTDVIVKIIDFNDMYKKIDLYCNPEQVKQLIALLEKAPETCKKLKANESKSDMFK